MSNHPVLDAVREAEIRPRKAAPLPMVALQSEYRNEVVIVPRGMHHGSASYRVSIGEEVFSAPTRDEAVAKAVLSVLSDGGAHCIRIASQPE